MSVKVYVGKERWTKGHSRWAPALNNLMVELDDEIVADAKLMAALHRLAKAIVVGRETVNDCPIIGINFIKVDFKYMLGEEEKGS